MGAKPEEQKEWRRLLAIQLGSLVDTFGEMLQWLRIRYDSVSVLATAGTA